jgi:hypothetical protein
MPASFQSILLMSKPAQLTAGLFEKSLRDIAGSFIQELDIPMEGGGQPNLLTLNGIQVALLNIDARAPGFSEYTSDGPNLLWPSVETDLAKHKAHIIVSFPIQGDGQHRPPA